MEQPPPYVSRVTNAAPNDVGGSGISGTVPTSILSSTTMPESVLPSPPFLTPPANFVSIVETHNAVRGSWTIDTTLPPPPAFVRPVSSPARSNPGLFRKIASFFPETPDRYVGPTPNLKLKSTHGRVDANVRIVRGSANLKPARIDVRSTHGSIRLAIVSIHHDMISILPFYQTHLLPDVPRHTKAQHRRRVHSRHLGDLHSERFCWPRSPSYKTWPIHSIR